MSKQDIQIGGYVKRSFMAQPEAKKRIGHIVRGYRAYTEPVKNQNEILSAQL
jgi:hypothetical protein